MDILKWPDPRLMKISKKTSYEEAKPFFTEMFKTMKQNNGIGLAGPQVGILKRFFVLDEKSLSTSDERKYDSSLEMFINPVIVDGFGEVVIQEGCLSVPGEIVNTLRAPFISVDFIDLDGKERQETFSGMTAIAIQHEVDHLDGRVLPELLPLEKRQEMLERIENNES